VRVIIRETTDTGDEDWIALRGQFIPELDPRQQKEFLRAFAQKSSGFSAFIATDPTGRAVGFAEVSIRVDYVNGCHYRPALFLEGIFVVPECRGQGIARAICAAAEEWGRSMGCREFASDVYIDDDNSLAAHAGLGFEETERVVYFCKPLFPGT
jgi:aminoglycoside 6'-N-acetyltransferase I